ncbi:4-fold beta flower protein [Niallia taxi]|uniref:4-fold beta flower protein n=1 Tax=Niallia taxi TaxID=2499688 RepID=UPI0015F728B3|nr:hypothetical protein [Niallia taxi]
MSEIVFYNKNGTAIAYSQDGQHIYTFTGKPVAYLYDVSVYSYSGKHLGRYENGWIRDNKGRCALFTSEASGGPVKPVKKVKPIKSVKQVKPVKSVKSVKPVKPVSSLSWSDLSSENFFYQ